MTTGSFRFEGFTLDPQDRQLRLGDAPVELNARYLDALTLLVREQAKLVSKDRFLEDVWRGVPVTDEALTQCIKTLRRQLGDDAARPRFIETVPKHGYRFIAAVNAGDAAMAVPAPATLIPPLQISPLRRFVLLGGAGTMGGGLAGVLGGIFYGVAGASQALHPGTGAISILLVLLWLTIVAALTGGAGVSFGIAAAGFAHRNRAEWGILGGMLGGLCIGGFVKLLGLDAFDLLLGRSPGDITGAAEGAVLGLSVGLGAWLGSRDAGNPPLRRSVVRAALVGGTAGVLIPLLGGRLMGGSLDLLAQHFPDLRLHLDQIGALFGETGFGTVSQIVTGALEGSLFGACVVGTMILAQRSLDARPHAATAIA